MPTILELLQDFQPLEKARLRSMNLINLLDDYVCPQL
jgi:hypothetical protein